MVSPHKKERPASNRGCGRRCTPKWTGLGLGCRRSRRLLVLVFDRRELEALLTVHVNLHRVASGDLSSKQLLRKLVFDSVCNHAPQRSGAAHPAESLLGKKTLLPVPSSHV